MKTVLCQKGGTFPLSRYFMGFLHCSMCPPYVEIKKGNTSLVPIQWAKPHDATKMPQLLCVKLEDRKKITSQALRRSRAVIHLGGSSPPPPVGRVINIPQWGAG